MKRRPPRSTRTDTLFPYTTLFRSDQQARKEFQDGLRDDPVPFTPDNCAATFGNIWTNRRDLYLRGIANVFAKLDRRFRSHHGFKIGPSLIIDRAWNEWGQWDRDERRDTVR